MKRLLLGAALVLVTTEAGAAPPKATPATKACVAAHEQAIEHRTQKKPHAARERLVACARAECPALLRSECADLLAQVTKDAPTVVLDARDDAGHDTTSVKVLVDGEVIATRLTGAAVDVEPGEHVFRFEREDGKSMEQRVLVVLGEKNRKVTADFSTLVPRPEKSTAPEPPPREPERGLSPVVYVAAGIAVAALGSFTYFALHGKSEEKDLAGSCAPRCRPGDVDPISRDYLAADISLGVAAVAAAVAVFFALPAFGSRPTAALPPAPWLPRVRQVHHGRQAGAR